MTIKCAGYMTKHSLLACKKLFNSPKLKDLQQRPFGTTAKFCTCYANAKSPHPSEKEMKVATRAKLKAKAWSTHIQRVSLALVQALDLPVDYLGNQITLRQVLVGIQLRDYLDCNLFSFKNRVFYAICHTGYSKEACQVTENIVTLSREYFGPETAVWFTPEACEEASFQIFNQETSTIEEDGNKGLNNMDMLDAFGHEVIEATR